MNMKPYFKRLIKDAPGLVRIILSATLAGSLYALACIHIFGAHVRAWQSGMVSAWIMVGYWHLMKQHPTSMRETGHLFVRAIIWPWYVFHDSTLSGSEHMSKLRLSFLVLLFFVGWGFIDKAPASNQLPPLAQDFVSFVQAIGIFFTGWWVVRSTVVFGNPMQSIWGLYWRIMLLALGIAGIGYYASYVAASLEWINANPGPALTALVAVAFVRFLFGIAPRYQWVIDKEFTHGAAAVVLSSRAEPTARDNRVTSAHEAGHALILATLGFLPNDAKVVMHDHSERGVLGYVRTLEWEHLLVPKKLSEWKMLAFLGGQVAEEVLLGEAALGSNSDMVSWLGEAKAYLSNGFSSTYFNPPENQHEAGLNQTILDALRRDQRILLQHYFGKNKQVLKDLDAALLDRRTLTKSDLIPFLLRVEFVDGFPMPNGEFAEFNPE